MRETVKAKRKLARRRNVGASGHLKIFCHQPGELSVYRSGLEDWYNREWTAMDAKRTGCQAVSIGVHSQLRVPLFELGPRFGYAALRLSLSGFSR
jgi:hypothetical protein